jgi:mannose-1-phosphate guanylyltransferase
MATTSNHYVLILCGGTGPRLWPMSRASNPKQFLSLFSEKTLLQETFSRYQKIVPTSHIFIVSNARYKEIILKQLKNLPRQNLIVEPEKKNTAMAIIYGSALIHRLNPQAIITSAPADHLISKEAIFSQAINSAAKIALSGQKIVTIGIKPTYPNPSFGYILPDSRFVEKPSINDAQLYIKKGAFWNSGIYTFSLNTLEKELQSHQPKYYSLYQQLIKNPKSVNTIFKQSENLSFDVAISEKSNSLTSLPAKFIWSDIGEWKAIWEQLKKNQDGLATIGKNTSLTSIKSKDCLVYTQPKKIVGLVGAHNLAIIDTPDALLVCNLNDSFFVRDLITQIVSSPKLKNYFLH